MEPAHGDGISAVGCLPVRCVLPAAPFTFDSVLFCSHTRHFHTPLLNRGDRSLLSLPKLEISALFVNCWCIAVRAWGYSCFPEQLAQSLSNRSLAPLARFELGESSGFLLVEEFSWLYLLHDNAISGRLS